MARWVARAIAVLSPAWAGCAPVLGIEELPAGDDGGAIDASADASVDRAADASPDVVSDTANDVVDGACATGDLSCNGAQPQICVGAGMRKDVGAPCSGTTPACLGGACVACSPGAVGCNGQQPQTCDGAGAWQNTGPACNNQACVNGVCTGGCTPGAAICLYNNVLVCTSEGAWAVTGVHC